MNDLDHSLWTVSLHTQCITARFHKPFGSSVISKYSVSQRSSFPRLDHGCVWITAASIRARALKRCIASKFIFLSIDTTIQKFGVGKIGISRDQFSLLTSCLLACLLLSYWLHNSTSLYPVLKINPVLNNYLTNY